MSWVLPFIAGCLVTALFVACWQFGIALCRSVNDRIHRSL